MKRGKSTLRQLIQESFLACVPTSQTLSQCDVAGRHVVSGYTWKLGTTGLYPALPGITCFYPVPPE
eukprot:1240693-Amorphochlora_amoeboformis.AAC.1